MAFPFVAYGSEEETFNTYSTEKVPVGTKMTIEDGRTYRFSEVFTSALAPCKLAQGEIIDIAKTGDQAIATLASGVTVLTGIGSTTASFTADELKYGYVLIDSAANLNPAYRIKSNTAITAGAATGTITLYNALILGVLAAETVSFIKNFWRDIIIAATGKTAAPVGVNPVAIAANEFGWVQTGGPARCLLIGSVLEGDNVVVNATTAGGAMPSAAFETDGPIVGFCLLDQPTTEYGLIYLQIE